MDTRWGPLSVTICGDRGKTPCLTFHDVGLNHHSCFQSLLLACGPKSLLLKHFCFYHVDAPGCQVGGVWVRACAWVPACWAARRRAQRWAI